MPDETGSIPSAPSEGPEASSPPRLSPPSTTPTAGPAHEPTPQRAATPPPVIAFMAPPDPAPAAATPRRRATSATTDPDSDASPAPRTRSRRATKSAEASGDEADSGTPAGTDDAPTDSEKPAKATRARKATKATKTTKATKVGRGSKAAADEPPGSAVDSDSNSEGSDNGPEDRGQDSDGDDESGSRRRRGRRGRGRGKSGDADEAGSSSSDDGDDDGSDRGPGGSDRDSSGSSDAQNGDDDSGSSTKRRRRRRRRSDEDGSEGSGGGDEDVRGISGSTRLEAKRQRRKEGRDTGRRRAPILTEAEFLARRESVDRAMVIRETGERIQIAVLEDDILVEHYITQASSNSFAGNVYLGKVQNVLPSMEAAFVDIGKGRNAVLYAGEVNWDAAGLEGKSRNIEQALKSGDSVVVQVTKDPLGHKGARLTSQISLPGRYLVYVPNGSMTGISRKLPDVERTRLKTILKKIVPEDAGVIIRTAAEGASEEELTRDVNRLQAQWEVIQKKGAASSTPAPGLLYEEPDLAIRVIRDVFNEDFTKLIVAGSEAWDTVEAYVAHVAPDLSGRLSRHTGESDVFADLRIDEQLAKALDRKVWLPSGGSLVIDRTEAMTVVDVNTGKYTGSGGNLEQTVTRNNLEAAEEIVRQLRLRDIGGIIVIDFIDMVLESNRDLVLRRLTECLGRDRTRHQVAEVTSLGLVQMTRKRVGQGLLEAYSEPCDHCSGRGIIIHAEPVEERRRRPAGNERGGGGQDRGNGGGGNGGSNGGGSNNGGNNNNGGGEAKSGRSRGRGRSSGADRSDGGNGATVDTDSNATAEPAVSNDGGRPGGHLPSPPAPAAPSAPASAAPSAPASADTFLPTGSVPATTTEPAGAEPSAPEPAAPKRRGRRAASRPAGPPVANVGESGTSE